MRTANETWMLASALICSLVTAFVITQLAPNFKAVFDNFGAELPGLTLFFIKVGWALWLLPLLVLAVWVFTPKNPQKPERRGKVVLLVAIGLSAVLLPLALLAMYLPIFKLGEAVGG